MGKWRGRTKESQVPSHLTKEDVTVLQNQFSTEIEAIFSSPFPKEGEFLTVTQWLLENILEGEEEKNYLVFS